MKIKFGLLFAACSFLIACNGEDSLTLLEPTTSVSGKVMDDPLSNAKVCFDENKNMNCDESEHTSISEAEGKYHFEAIPIRIVNTAPLLAEISTDTINEATGLAIETPFKLTSFLGCTNVITPYTSMVQHLVEQSYSIEDAENKVKRKAMTDMPLCSDYVAQSTNNALDDYQKDEYRHLHRMANIFTGYMMSNMETLTSNAEIQTSLKTQDMHSILMQHQMKHLAAIVEDLDSVQSELDEDNASFPSVSSAQPQAVSSGIDFNTVKPKLARSNKVMPIDLASRDVEEEAIIMNAMKNSQQANLLEEWVSAEPEIGGYYHYMDKQGTDNDNLSFVNNRIVRLPYETNLGDEFYLNNFYEEHIWDSETNSFQNNELFRSDLRLFLDSGFTKVNNSPSLFGKNSHTGDWQSVFFNKDPERYGPFEQQARLIFNNESDDFLNIKTSFESYTLDATSYDISNKKIQSLLNLDDDLSIWNNVITNDSRFSDNSKAYKFTRRAAVNLLFCNESESENADDVAEETINNPCQKLSVFATKSGVYYGRVGANNTTFYHRNTIENLGRLTQVAILNVPYFPVIYKIESDYIIVFLHINKNALFYRMPIDEFPEFPIFWIAPFDGFQRDNFPAFYGFDFPYIPTIARSRWEKVKVDGNDMIALSIPESIKRLNPKFTSKMAFFIDNGTLHLGSFYKKGELIEENITVPYRVHTQIIEALDSEKVESVQNE